MKAIELDGFLEDYLALKRTLAEGSSHYDRLARNQFNYRVSLLRSFLAFWKERGSPWPIQAIVALDWVAIGADCQRPYRDLRRLQVVQAFLKQVRVFEPATEIPENVFRTSVGRRTPHIFTDHEVERLLALALQHRNRNTLYPLTLYTLIGLLASTGLRIGETIRLKVEDAQLAADPPHLLIYETKFYKSRKVVLHSSTAEQLRQYLVRRAAALRGKNAVTFFINRSGRALEYNSIRSVFMKLLKRAGIQSLAKRRAPLFHSFRHTFAVKRLTQWYRESRNVQELLPHLAVYLGHIGPEYTYWYVTESPELLQAAADLFERHGREGGATQ
jgi:integrase